MPCFGLNAVPALPAKYRLRRQPMCLNWNGGDGGGTHGSRRLPHYRRQSDVVFHDEPPEPERT